MKKYANSYNTDIYQKAFTALPLPTKFPIYHPEAAPSAKIGLSVARHHKSDDIIDTNSFYRPVNAAYRSIVASMKPVVEVRTSAVEAHLQSLILPEPMFESEEHFIANLKSVGATDREVEAALTKRAERREPYLRETAMNAENRHHFKNYPNYIPSVPATIPSVPITTARPQRTYFQKVEAFHNPTPKVIRENVLDKRVPPSLREKVIDYNNRHHYSPTVLPVSQPTLVPPANPERQQRNYIQKMETTRNPKPRVIHEHVTVPNYREPSTREERHVRRRLSRRADNL